MNHNKIKQVGIIANLKKPKALEEVKRLCKWLIQHHYTYCLSENLTVALEQKGQGIPLERMSKKTQLTVVMGGDGTLLWGARSGAYGKNPVLGVNLGSLGFLVGVSVDELYPMLKKVLDGDYAVEKRIMLEAQVWRKKHITTNGVLSNSSELKWKQVALNDAVISKETLSRMVQLKISINDKMVTEYRADGIIIATPTGSTAHSLSAGGPIVHPTVDAIIITPICPHTLSNRPLLVKGEDIITIEIMTSRENTYLTLDGQEGVSLEAGDIVKLKHSSKPIYLINCPNKDYYDILHTKLHWGRR